MWATTNLPAEFFFSVCTLAIHFCFSQRCHLLPTGYRMAAEVSLSLANGAKTFLSDWACSPLLLRGLRGRYLLWPILCIRQHRCPRHWRKISVPAHPPSCAFGYSIPRWPRSQHVTFCGLF